MMWNTSGESFNVDHYPIIKIPQSQSEIRILKLRPRDQHQWLNHPKKRNLLQREKHNKRISFFKKNRHKKCKIVPFREEDYFFFFAATFFVAAAFFAGFLAAAFFAAAIRNPPPTGKGYIFSQSVN